MTKSGYAGQEDFYNMFTLDEHGIWEIGHGYLSQSRCDDYVEMLGEEFEKWVEECANILYGGGDNEQP